MSAMDDPKLIETLTRLETKLDNFINTSTDHESRIRGLEKRVWSIPTGAFLVNLVGVVITYLSMHHQEETWVAQELTTMN